MALHLDLKSNPARTLVAIKLLHTVVWFFFVVCIVAVPIAGALRRFSLAAVLAGLVLLECLVLVMNRFRCPIGDWARLFTDEPVDNYDIYLPVWLARHNKTIFGTLFVIGGLFTLAQWLMAGR
ncbi:MAG: hypothetical protein P4K94_10955 [Terracidiphilus sp.]|nr:hypothetical protein [Terracidiphilus sp.]